MTIALSMTLSFGGVYAGDSANSGVRSYRASNGERLEGYVEGLSEGIGVRLMGTPNEKAAAEYIQDEFAKIGYDAVIQEYLLPENSMPTVSAVTIGGKEYYGNYYYNGEMNQITEPKIKDFTLSDPDENDKGYIDGWDVEEGDFVVVNNGLFKKLESLDAAGNDASCFLHEAIEKAETGKAAGIIVYNDESNKSLTLENITDNEVPVLAFDAVVGKMRCGISCNYWRKHSSYQKKTQSSLRNQYPLRTPLLESTLLQLRFSRQGCLDSACPLEQNSDHWSKSCCVHKNCLL